MDDESWMLKYWRICAMATYTIICLFDFVIAPILCGWYSIYTGNKLVQWIPLTVQGASAFHLAFGGILTAYSYTRGQEILQTNGLNAQYLNRDQPPTVENTTVVNNEYDTSQYRK